MPKARNIAILPSAQRRHIPKKTDCIFFTMGSSQSSSGNEKKGSLYQRYQDHKRGQPLSDEEIKKYTGKSRDEINTWAETAPGVGRNQLAGKAGAGSASGLAGVAMADGLGGWGLGAEPQGQNRGMKFPPAQADAKKVDSEQE